MRPGRPRSTTNRIPLRVSLAAVSLALAVACGDRTGTEPDRARGQEGWFDRSVVPPVAERRPHETGRHDRTFVDPYHYMRDRTDPKVIAYLQAENDYTRAAMAPTRPLQETLSREMAERISDVDLSEPVAEHGYLYSTRHDPGKQYPVHLRKKDAPGAAEEIVLDENAIGAGHDYSHVGDLKISPDGTRAAFTHDIDGGERYTVRFKDLTTGRMLDDRIEGAFDTVEWGDDSRTLYYTTIDATHRPYRLHRHRIGSDPAVDERIYQEDDVAFYLSLRKTRSGRFLVLHLESTITAEEHLIEAGDPAARPRLIERRRPGTLYAADHWRDRLYIRTSDLASPWRLVTAPVADPSRARWTDVPLGGVGTPAAGRGTPEAGRGTPAATGVMVLEEIQAFADHLVLLERRDGVREIRVLDLPGHGQRSPRFEEPVHTLELIRNPRFDSTTIRVAYQSPLTPESIHELDLKTGALRLLRRRPIGGGYDPAAYEVTRAEAAAGDGTPIPMVLVHRRGIRRDGRNPLLLYAYGSGNLTVEPEFSPEAVSLLDRGFMLATAWIRGGGEYGRGWAEQGRLLNKVTSFTDFIACADHLIATGWTARDRLAIQGGSAGGLLMGAVVTMRPELFAAVIAEVPFVDVLNTQEDPSIPLTVTGWEEWGDPRRADHFAVMLSYSPYDNVAARDYPHLLITGGLNDPRVPFWEPAKWTARLRATKTGDRILLLRMDMGSGHGGASGRYDALEDRAFQYAFILNALGSGGSTMRACRTRSTPRSRTT